jgi:peptide/nickel transport system substrate-binding protein
MFFLKQIRFNYHLALAIAQKHWRVLALSLLAGGATFFWEPKLAQWLAAFKTERIGLVGKHQLDNLPDEVLTKLGRGLTQVNEKGEASGDLAAGWEIKQEGREYLFTLKDNLFWNDGKPVKAGEIKYNLSDVTTEIPNEKQIRFLLRESYSPFPSILAKPVFKGRLIGSGDYHLRQIKLNGQIVAEIKIEPREGRKPKFVYRFYPTNSAARTAFKLGEVDQLKDLEELGDLASWQNIKKESFWLTNQIVSLIFNTQDPLLTNKSTRQALAYAIKKDRERRAVSSISPESWAFNPHVKPYNFDLANAKQLLKKGPEIKEIELQTAPLLVKTAEAIKKDWQALGIETKIKSIESLSGNFQARLIIQEVPTDPDQYVLWHSTQPANLSHLKNPKIDKLLEDGRKLTSQEERKTIYQDLQRFLNEEVPAVFLYYPILYNLTRENLF